MNRTRNKRPALLTGLALTTMLLGACADGPTMSAELKISPGSAFLEGLATEYQAGEYGPHTREVVKDWVTQNEPDELAGGTVQ